MKKLFKVGDKVRLNTHGPLPEGIGEMCGVGEVVRNSNDSTFLVVIGARYNSPFSREWLYLPEEITPA